MLFGSLSWRDKRFETIYPGIKIPLKIGTIRFSVNTGFEETIESRGIHRVFMPSYGSPVQSNSVLVDEETLPDPVSQGNIVVTATEYLGAQNSGILVKELLIARKEKPDPSFRLGPLASYKIQLKLRSQVHEEILLVIECYREWPYILPCLIEQIQVI